MQKEFDNLLAEIKETIIHDAINPHELLDQNGIANIIGERSGSLQANHLISIFTLKQFYVSIFRDTDLWIRKEESEGSNFHLFMDRVISKHDFKNICSSRVFRKNTKNGENPQIHYIMDIFSDKLDGINFVFEFSRYEPKQKTEQNTLAKTFEKPYDSSKTIFDKFIGSNISKKDLVRLNNFLSSKTIINFIDLVFSGEFDPKPSISKGDTNLSSLNFNFYLDSNLIKDQSIIEVFDLRELSERNKSIINQINEEKKTFMKAQNYINANMLALNLQLSELNKVLNETLSKINELEEKLYHEKRNASCNQFPILESGIHESAGFDSKRFKELSEKYKHITKISL